VGILAGIITVSPRQGFIRWHYRRPLTQPNKVDSARNLL
jgi:hypothetical protein